MRLEVSCLLTYGIPLQVACSTVGCIVLLEVLVVVRKSLKG